MKIPCTNCNQHLEIPEELAGQTIECPACNASLAVPSPELPPPSTPQSVMFCSKCGIEQKDNAKFCHSCGHTLTETQPSDSSLTSTINTPQVQVTTSQAAAPSKASSPKESKSPIPKWAIAAVVGVVIVVVALIMFFPDGSNGVLPSEPPDISIHEAAENGNIEAVKQHLAAGTDVDVKGGRMGGTPLHYAATHGHKEIVELLIAKGADVDAKGSIGQTSLHDVAQFGHKETAELLIANGADVNAKDIDGTTPLDLAIGLLQTEIADLLRKHGGKTGEELKAERK